MNCPQTCLSCCYCLSCCSPCVHRWLSEKKASQRRISFVEYRQTPEEPTDSSEWPSRDLRVPIGKVLDTPDVYGYGLDPQPEGSGAIVTQQPRSPAHHRSPMHQRPKRRVSQPAYLYYSSAGLERRASGVQSQPTSPLLSRRVSHPASPRRSSSPYHSLYGPSPHGSPLAGRRRSIQMASLHEDFYSESSSEGAGEEADDGGIPIPGDPGSEYETSVTSYEEEEEEEEEGQSASAPLLPKSHLKPKHSATIPQIIVTEPFEIGPDPMLQFSLYYDFKRRTLIVHLQKAFNLPIKDPEKETCHAFVVVYLLPNRETDRETYESRVVHNSCNPNFDEMFQFPRLKQEVARQQTLILRIYHQCGPKHNTIIGGVLQPLENEDFHGKTIRKRIVEDVEEYQQDTQGRLLVSLTFNPSIGTLDGTIFEANNLTKQDVFGLADPYVKVYLIYKGKRLGKWKTKVKKNTLVPVFNESFQFLIPGLNMKDLMLQVVVMDYDRFSRNDHVGIVDLGCDVSNDSGRNHWMEIISNPKEPISHWHPILQAKKKSRKSKQPSTATNLPMCLSPQR